MTDRGVIVVGGEALVDLVPHAAGELRAHPAAAPTTRRARWAASSRTCTTSAVCPTTASARGCARSSLEDGVRLDTVVETALPTTLALAELDAAGAATYRFYTEGTSAPALTPEDGARGAARARRHAARRHARARHGADRGRARGRRRGGRRDGADHGRPELPADVHRRPRQLSPRRWRRRCATRTWSRSASTTSSTSSRAPSPRPRRARCSPTGRSVALVTLGGDGALIVTARGRGARRGAEIQVVDTIGAGDAFGGGFLAWWRLQGPRPRRARRRRRRPGGDALRVHRRRPDVRARGSVAAAARRAVIALEIPIVLAPLAGGPSTPELAAAVSGAGGLGFLAAGYLSAEQLEERLERTRALTDRPFGVNLFVPGPVGGPGDLRALRRAASPPRASSSARRGRTTTTGTRSSRCSRPTPPAVVSFTFGCPAPDVLARFPETWVTVTQPGGGARRGRGRRVRARRPGRRGRRPPRLVGRHAEPRADRAASRCCSSIDVDVPLVATGGIATAAAVQAVLALGARAAQVGTAFMRAPEAGTSPGPPRRARDRRRRRRSRARSAAGSRAASATASWTSTRTRRSPTRRSTT